MTLSEESMHLFVYTYLHSLFILYRTLKNDYSLNDAKSLPFLGAKASKVTLNHIGSIFLINTFNRYLYSIKFHY